MKEYRLLVLLLISTLIMCLYLVVYHQGPAVKKVIVQPTAPDRSFEEKNNIAEADGRIMWWQSFLCSYTKHFAFEDTGSGHLLQLPRNISPSKENGNVFLVDTACNNFPRYRVWCSLESWAQQNPDLEIWFVMTSTSISYVDHFPASLLQKYPNLNVVGADIEKLFEGTPLLQLFESRRWTLNDTWPVELLSDMLRVLVLWHWGGVYSDTDVISIRPFSLPLNSLGYETTFQIGSAVYSFKAHHPFLWRLMEDMTNGFKPDLWGSIGPKAITRVVKEQCGVEDLKPFFSMTPVNCGNITLLPKRAFYPIDYTRSSTFFLKKKGRKFDSIFQHSSSIHFWNKLSKKYIMTKGDFSLYEVAAKRFCPVTYDTSMKESNTL